MRIFVKVLLPLVVLLMLVLNTVAISSVGIRSISMNSKDKASDCENCHNEKITSISSHFIESDNDCQFCHIVNTNSSDHEILSIKDNDVCVACHVEQSEFNSSDAHSTLLCIECHNPHGSSQDYMFNKTVVTLCNEVCHTKKELGNSHAVGGDLIDKRTGQQLTCISTCHNLHNAKEEKLLQYSVRNVCYECHKEMY